MNKTVKPEIQGDKVVLREWVGDELPMWALKQGLSDRRAIEANAPTYEHHPDHESYFRERIGVKTDVEIVKNEYITGSYNCRCTNCKAAFQAHKHQPTCIECSSIQYAIPKQEDDLWEEAEREAEKQANSKYEILDEPFNWHLECLGYFKQHYTLSKK